jgi:hypothetical protein
MFFLMFILLLLPNVIFFHVTLEFHSRLAGHTAIEQACARLIADMSALFNSGSIIAYKIVA